MSPSPVGLALAPARAPAPPDAAGAYVRASFERFERVLIASATSLPEPRAPRARDRALVRLDDLVDTLAGLAVGITVGQLVAALGRGFGAAGRELVGAHVDALRRAAPPRRRPVAVWSAGNRPLVGELVARLQPCLCLCAARAAATVQAIEAASSDGPVPRSALAMTLRLLAADDASALAFTEHLALGWRCFAASIAGAPLPELPASAWPTGEATWRAFWHRLHPAAAPAIRPLTQRELVARGFLIQIA